MGTGHPRSDMPTEADFARGRVRACDNVACPDYGLTHWHRVPGDKLSGRDG